MAAFHKHPRIVGNDYTKGSYFVTICTFQQRQLFGLIVAGADEIRKMELNEAGRIVQECWLEIPKHFPHVELHEMQVMPDHLHGILILRPRSSTRWVDGTIAGDGTIASDDTMAKEKDPPRAKGPARGSLGAIIGAFKSETAKRINRLLGTPGQRIWLHGYHEHQIRTAMGEFGRIARYIAENPQRWKK